MLTHFPEQTIKDFYIPAFTLHGSDFILIELPFNPHSTQVQQEIMAILQQNCAENLSPPLLYAPHKMESVARYRFWPTRVGEYLRKNADPASPFYLKIYNDIPWIKPHTPLHDLSGAIKRKLSVYATLTKTYRIMFDLVGVDPERAIETVKTAQQVTASGGCAILFDRYDEFKPVCSQHIKPVYSAPNP